MEINLIVIGRQQRSASGYETWGILLNGVGQRDFGAILNAANTFSQPFQIFKIRYYIMFIFILVQFIQNDNQDWKCTTK